MSRKTHKKGSPGSPGRGVPTGLPPTGKKPSTGPGTPVKTSRYRSHDGIPHIWTNPIAQLAGQVACRDCGRFRTQIMREEKKEVKKRGAKVERKKEE